MNARTKLLRYLGNKGYENPELKPMIPVVDSIIDEIIEEAIEDRDYAPEHMYPM